MLQLTHDTEQLARKVADVLATKTAIPGDNVVPLTARR